MSCLSMCIALPSSSYEVCLCCGCCLCCYFEYFAVSVMRECAFGRYQATRSAQSLDQSAGFKMRLRSRPGFDVGVVVQRVRALGSLV